MNKRLEQQPSVHLGGLLQQCLRQYFSNMNGQQPIDLYRRLMDETEHKLLLETLAHTQGNKSLTARILGIHRNTLTKKLKQHNILASRVERP